MRVRKSGIGQLIHTDPDKDGGSVIYHNDMTLEGQFLQPQEFIVRKGNEDEFWNTMKVCLMLKEIGCGINFTRHRNERGIIGIGSEFSS